MNSATTATIQLTTLDLGISAALILVAGAVSVILRLGMEKQLAVASIRTVVQLLLVGYILKVVFRIDNPLPLLAVLAVMIIFASRAAVDRTTRRVKGVAWITFLTLLVCGLLTTFTVTSLIIDVEPWYQPRYVVPLLGMILGNGLTGISLCLDQLLESLSERRCEIEMELALGATRWEAAQRPISAAVQRGMIPIVNSMMVVGVVSLPGMMTGQILAGADPIIAVKYQIMVMFMLAASTSLGCILTALLLYRILFNTRHQLRYDLIKRKN